MVPKGSITINYNIINFETSLFNMIQKVWVYSSNNFFSFKKILFNIIPNGYFFIIYSAYNQMDGNQAHNKWSQKTKIDKINMVPKKQNLELIQHKTKIKSK